MPKVLSEDQVARYRREGFLTPITVMPPADARAVMDAWEKESGKRAKTHLRGKPHLLLTALAKLIRAPRLLDVIEDLIGPDIVCLETGFLWKDARDPGFVAWHQDSTYMKFDPPLALNAWIALTDSKLDNGAMQFIVDSHKLGDVPYEMVPAENHMLKFSRQVVGVDTSRRVTASTRPLRNLTASIASMAAITPTIGPSTPAVSQVATAPGTGQVSRRHRRQGDRPGSTGRHWPSAPTQPV